MQSMPIPARSYRIAVRRSLRFPSHASAVEQNGRVIFNTYDNAPHAFGANIERHSKKSIQIAR